MGGNTEQTLFRTLVVVVVLIMSGLLISLFMLTVLLALEARWGYALMMGTLTSMVSTVFILGGVQLREVW